MQTLCPSSALHKRDNSLDEEVRLRALSVPNRMVQETRDRLAATATRIDP